MLIGKNYLSNLPPSSRQVILNKESIYNNKNKVNKINKNNNSKGIDINKKLKYNHKNKFDSNNINSNLNDKFIKKENNSLEELKNKNPGFNKGLLINRKIMTATNSPCHSIQINNFNKMNNNNNNINNKVNINKFQKNSKKSFKKSQEIYNSNKHSNNINNNEIVPNLLMDSNKNDISGTTYDNLLWTCNLYNFGLTSQDHLTNITAECGYNFLFDTGSNTMILPMETFNLLYKNLDVFDCEKAENEYGVQIVCPDNDNLPDIFIEVGNHYLILDHKEMFNRYSTSGKQILNVVFKKDITISIIGQPFFKLFHTKFDFENGLLKFYNEDKKYFIYSTEKPNNDKARDFEPIMSDISNWFSEHLLKIVLVAGSLLAVILIIVIMCKCCKKNHSKKQSTLIEKKGKGKESK
jgi:hypothetical protein